MIIKAENVILEENNKNFIRENEEYKKENE